MQPNPWRDLEDLWPEWSVSVKASGDDEQPIQIDAAQNLTLFGQPAKRARVIGHSVAEATPRLLRQIARVSAVLLV